MSNYCDLYALRVLGPPQRILSLCRLHTGLDFEWPLLSFKSDVGNAVERMPVADEDASYEYAWYRFPIWPAVVHSDVKNSSPTTPRPASVGRCFVLVWFGFKHLENGHCSLEVSFVGLFSIALSGVDWFEEPPKVEVPVNRT